MTDAIGVSLYVLCTYVDIATFIYQHKSNILYCMSLLDSNSGDKGKYATVPLLIVGFAAAMVMVAVFMHLTGVTIVV